MTKKIVIDWCKVVVVMGTKLLIFRHGVVSVVVITTHLI